MTWLAVAAGAVLGAWLRWRVGLALNTESAPLPWGTLLVNLVGGYLIGLAFGFFQTHPSFPAEWRLFAVTGFLGALTTFSAFSAESMVLLEKGDYLWAIGHSTLHLAGSVAFCIAGFATYRTLAP
jgi:CrcB protein